MPNLGNFRFRSKTESGADKESAYERRRSQVRRAQRNHRERKENYIKALEAEVVKLRQYSQEDFRDINRLKLTLQQYNIPLPDLESAQRPPESEQENAGPIDAPEKPSLTIKRPSKGKSLQVERVSLGAGEQSSSGRKESVSASQRLSPAFATDVSEFSNRSSPLSSVRGSSQQPEQFSPEMAMRSMDISGRPQRALQHSVSTGGAPEFRIDAPGQQYPSMQGGYNVGQEASQMAAASTATLQNPPVPTTAGPSDLDSSVIGMEFVLALEHPCMGHIDMVRQPYSTHSHMASSQLLDHAPASVNDENTAPTLWNVPLAEVGGPENANAGIQKLLALSGTFQLQGEITPVQAWFKVRNDPRFRLLQETVTGTGPGAATGRMSIGTATALERLERLRQVLWGDVKCYGFGAVMDEQIFEIGMEEALGGIGVPQ